MISGAAEQGQNRRQGSPVVERAGFAIVRPSRPQGHEHSGRGIRKTASPSGGSTSVEEVGGFAAWYWSSTPNNNNAWNVNMSNGSVNNNNHSNNNWVWPCRSGEWRFSAPEPFMPPNGGTAKGVFVVPPLGGLLPTSHEPISPAKAGTTNGVFVAPPSGGSSIPAEAGTTNASSPQRSFVVPPSGGSSLPKGCTAHA
jgi:hypothetical protein